MKAGRRGFSQVLSSGIFERPMLARVMATPQWPVPYYERLFKAYPVRKREGMSLVPVSSDMCETYWVFTKSALSKTERGRQVLHDVEQNTQGNTFLMHLKDVGNLSRSYVFELSQFLDIAHNENKRILSTRNLI